MKQALRTIQSSELRGNFAEAMKFLKKTKKPLIIEQRNVPSAVLVDIDEYEDYINSIDPTFLASVAKARKQVHKKTFSMRDVFGNV